MQEPTNSVRLAIRWSRDTAGRSANVNLKGGSRAMDWLTLALMLMAVYVAVMALVRLMRGRRDQLVSEVQQQIEARRQQSGAAHNQKVKR